VSPRPTLDRLGTSSEAAAPYLTKQELVYRSLRDAIMRCELAPGQRLVIDELARRLRVSAIPVREALHLLTSERLVVNVPHVGATVAPIVPESVQEVFTVMEGWRSSPRGRRPRGSRAPRPESSRTCCA
jgi:DNA-binding GntR family transcriptional regulator